jgi:hypothetical protein
VASAVEEHLERDRHHRQDPRQHEPEHGLADHGDRGVGRAGDHGAFRARERELERRVGLDDLLLAQDREGALHGSQEEQPAHRKHQDETAARGRHVLQLGEQIGDAQHVHQEDSDRRLHQHDHQRRHGRYREAADARARRHQLGHGQGDQLEVDEGAAESDGQHHQRDEERLERRVDGDTRSGLALLHDLRVLVDVAIDLGGGLEHLRDAILHAAHQSPDVLPVRAHAVQDAMSRRGVSPVGLECLLLRVAHGSLDPLEHLLHVGVHGGRDVGHGLHGAGPARNLRRRVATLLVVGIQVQEQVVEPAIQHRVLPHLLGKGRVDAVEFALHLAVEFDLGGGEQRLAVAGLQRLSAGRAPAGD